MLTVIKILVPSALLPSSSSLNVYVPSFSFSVQRLLLHPPEVSLVGLIV